LSVEGFWVKAAQNQISNKPLLPFQVLKDKLFRNYGFSADQVFSGEKVARLRSQHSQTGHTILVVDDDNTILITLAQLLQLEGHSVLTASGGIEALRLTHEHEIHLMLLDYFMPDMNGEEVVREVRKFDRNVQIVLQTGYSSERPARQMLRDLEIQGYHDKSEGPEKLLVWVDAALKAYRHARALRTSRDGLRYILRVTPELHKVQPLEDLMRGVLLQVQGLLGLSGAFIAIPESSQNPLDTNDGFVATVNSDQLELRVGTGRFERQTWSSLSMIERDLVQFALESGVIQRNQSLAVPLGFKNHIVGVVFIEQQLEADADIELLELFAAQAAIAIENVRLYDLATVDGLTRLMSRLHWMDRFGETLKLASRHGHSTSLLMLDLDGFKEINNNLGHLSGDHLLMKVGRVICESLRSTDIAGRYGGDEFSLVLPITDQNGATVIAERLRQAINGVSIGAGDKNPKQTISVSIGLCTLKAVQTELGNLGNQDLELVRNAMIENADNAMYQAKNQGNNRVVMGDVIELETLLK
jgi:two-component system, cell cycle response regulator